MAQTVLFLCLTLGLTRANLDQVRSNQGHPVPIPADGTPMPTNCAEDQWNNGTPDYPDSGSFRPHVGSIDHPASCSRFWRCNAPVDDKQSATLYECPPCPPENPQCKGNPLLVFDINTKSCNIPSSVNEFFTVGECQCNKCISKGCSPSNDASCYPWGDHRASAGPNIEWCKYCDGDDCVPGCLYDNQCAVGLICKDHKCVVPPCEPPAPPADECDCTDPNSCDHECSTCQAIVTWKCSNPPECCPDKPCEDNCYDCVDGTCKPKECGACNECENGECKPKECSVPCEECSLDSGECEAIDCGPCAVCNPETEQCEFKCDACQRCNTTIIEGVLTGICQEVDCGNCSTCNLDTDQCEAVICEDKCHECNIETDQCESCCGTCTECDVDADECKPKECPPCHTCNPHNNECEPVDCGPCGECNEETNECQGDQDKCKPECGVPHCEECVGVPGKNQFICQDICHESSTCEGCCCIDEDCQDFCEEGQVPACNCEEHKCLCHDVGKIVVNEILICTEKCEGCDSTHRTENMVLNLVGEQFLWGYPTCKTAEIKVPISEGECRTIGAGLDNEMCGGCWQYPLGGDIDESSSVTWLDEQGTWSGSFCVSWLPADNMYVKCEVVDGVVDDCDEVCDCHDLSRTVCPDKKSAKSKKSSGILGWFK